MLERTRGITPLSELVRFSELSSNYEENFITHAITLIQLRVVWYFAKAERLKLPMMKNAEQTSQDKIRILKQQHPI
jgi:hypothetical protein